MQIKGDDPNPRSWTESEWLYPRRFGYRRFELSADIGTLVGCAARNAWKQNLDHPEPLPEILSVAIVVEVASAASMTKEFEQALREKALEILKINPRPPYKPVVEEKEESGGIC